MTGREVRTPAVLAAPGDHASPDEAPVVSVLMMVYDHEKYLAQAIESVLAQRGGTSFELIIGEDCSNDGSLAIATRYRDSQPGIIRIITADRNVGAYANYMRMLAAARGEFIAQLDGDDFWLPGKLERQVGYLQDHPRCPAVYAKTITVDESGRRSGLFNSVGSAEFGIGALVRHGNFLCTSSMMFRADLRATLLEIRTVFIDYRTHLRLARNGPLVQLGRPMAAYRVRSSSSILASQNERVREWYWEALMDVPRELVADGDFARGLADFLRRVAFRALRTWRPGLFRHWWRRAAGVAPCGRARLACLVAGAIARQVRLAALGAATRWSGGDRVLYRL